MSPDSIQFVLLCLSPVIALFSVIFLHPSGEDLRAHRVRHLGLAVGGILCCYMLVTTSAYHKCHRGQPHTHIWLGLICLSAVLIGVRRGWRRILCAVLTYLVLEVSIQHYHYLVHSDDYIGELRVQVSAEQWLEGERLWHSGFTRIYRLRRESGG